MGLENLSNPFNDISLNTKERVDSSNSPVSNKLDDGSDFGRYSKTPISDSVFVNQSNRLKSGQSLIGNKRRRDLIYIDKIQKGQIDSPIARVVSGNTTTLARKDGDPELDLYGGYSGEVIDPEVRKKQLSINIGQNNKLGFGAFIRTNLYNDNHTANFDRPTGVSYGQTTLSFLRSGIGDLSNLNIRGTQQGNRIGGFKSGEPYVVRDIGAGVNYASKRDNNPVDNFVDDVSRLAKFYTSGRGALTIANEVLYGQYFAERYAGAVPKTLNQTFYGEMGDANSIRLIPADITTQQTAFNKAINFPRLASHTMVPALPSILTGFLGDLDKQQLGPSGSIRKPFAVNYSSMIKASKIIFGQAAEGKKSVSKIEQMYSVKADLEKGFLADASGDFAKKLPYKRDDYSKRKDFVQPTDSKKEFQKFNKLGYFDNGMSFGVEDKIAQRQPKVGKDKHMSDMDTLPNDFYVKIKDLRNNYLLYFRGFVTGLTENVNPSFTSANYVGRSEPVYLYERAERDLSFNLRLYPNNRKEFESMYEKMEYLTGLAYPEYYPEDVGFQRMKAPFTELHVAHIGTRKKGQFGFIKSLTYTVNETGDWDADTNLPRLIDVSFSYQILNRKAPKYGDKFYGHKFGGV